MANTYTPIFTVSASGGATAAIEFASIPAIYRDLVVRISFRGTNNQSQFALQMRFNDSSATSQYYTKAISGSGPAAGDYGVSGQSGLSYLYTGNGTANPNSSTVFTNTEIYIAGYTTSNVKTYSLQLNAASDASRYAHQQLFSGLWNNSAAINKISLYNEYGQFSQYSTATLYGITA